MSIIILRTVIVFLCIVAAMRLMGKRQLGQLELSELVVAVLISDLASHPLQDLGVPLIYGILPIVVLCCCELLISWLALKSGFFRRLIFGKPSILIRRGVIVQREMQKNRFSLDELSEELRNQGVTDISKVHSAVLETDGTLNVLLFAAEQPATAALLGQTAEERGLPVTLISDGKIDWENLRLLGKDEGWLRNLLKQQGYPAVKQVYYLSIDELGGVYAAAKEAGK